MPLSEKAGGRLAIFFTVGRVTDEFVSLDQIRVDLSIVVTCLVGVVCFFVAERRELFLLVTMDVWEPARYFFRRFRPS